LMQFAIFFTGLFEQPLSVLKLVNLHIFGIAYKLGFTVREQLFYNYVRVNHHWELKGVSEWIVCIAF